MSELTGVKEKIGRLEVKIENLDGRIDDLKDIKDVVVRLTLLQEQQMEYNKKYADAYDRLILSQSKFETTLEKININLNNMNNEINFIKKDVGNLQDRTYNLDNKSKVDILRLAKKAIPYLLGGGIVYYIIQLVG